MVHTTHSAEADTLRHALADELLRRGIIRTERVEQVFRTVPRHLFTPGTPLETAYRADDAVVTKRDAFDLALSSVSAPSIIAMMLEQARARPGERVLEIGSGGYNAALLAEMVGPAGSVTTLDIDPEIAARAEACLSAAGYDQVRVRCGDGEHGVADAAPFDLIIVTAGTWDVPPAWIDQLAAGGRIVAPLRLWGLTRSVALTREPGRLVGSRVEQCGFVAMQGAGAVADRLVLLRGNDVGLRVEADADAEALEGALAALPAQAWSQVTVAAMEPFDDLDLWLMATLPGFGLLSATQEAIDTGVVNPSWRIATPAATRGGSLAYRARLRPVDEARTAFEFGVYGHGPHGPELAEAYCEQIRRWDRDHRGGPGADIAVYPAGAPDAALPAERALVIDKRHTRVVISWPGRPAGQAAQGTPYQMRGR